jgi:hypothetical protein
VPEGLLTDALGHSAGLSDDVRLAWFATSASTVGGALGSGLEGDEAVREAAYGQRRRRRAGPAGDASS